MDSSQGVDGPAKPWSRVTAKRNKAGRDQDESVDAWGQGIAERMLGFCHPFQRNAVDDPARRVSLLCSRGAGKTTAMLYRAIIRLVTKRGARMTYVATSRPQAEQLAWLPLKDLIIDRLGIGDVCRFHETSKTLICEATGSSYRLVGADDKREIDKLRGQPYDEFQVDEAASHVDEYLKILLFRVVGPRLGERDGAIVLGGTPGHILSGLFFDVTAADLHLPYGDEREGWTGWSSHFWTSQMVAEQPEAQERYRAIWANWREALVEKETQRWSDDHPIWRREYMAQWAADDTANVYRYVASRNRWSPSGVGNKTEGLGGLKVALEALPKDLGQFHFVFGMDMGVSDPFAVDVFAFAPSDVQRRIWHVFGFDQREMYVRPIAELLLGPKLNHEAPGGITGLTGEPDALIFDGDKSHLDELAKVYGIRAKQPEKKPEYKMGAIELTNGDLVDARVLILEGSELEKQLEQLQWQVDDFGKVREHKAMRNDHADCLIYARRTIAQLFEAGIVTAPKENTAKDQVGVSYLLPPEPEKRVTRDESDYRDDNQDDSGYFLDIWKRR